MRINFLIPTTGLTGGMKVIFSHASNLAKRGHDVRLVYPYLLQKNAGCQERIIARIKMIRRSCLRLVGGDRISWFNLDDRIRLIRVFNLSEQNVPEADVTIATANETADWLVEYSEAKGEKYYFIQDYETWTRDSDKVDMTWRMPLKKIVVSQLLAQLAEDKFQQRVAAVVPNGIDHKQFYRVDVSSNQGKNILMLYHPFDKKGFVDGWEAFKIAKAKYPEIQLVCFGAYRPNAKMRKEMSFYFKPSPQKIRELYSSAEVFVWPSREEGYGLPPLEAMACGCAVIATDTGAIREYSSNGESALIVPPFQPVLLAESLVRLLDDRDFLNKIRLNGFERSLEFSLDKSFAAMEEILEKRMN